ncbi:MAG: penicillin-binding protein 2 [Sphaerobacter sp.]|nr:penicillin-binding protein 2 [Sphaerobacter sp.]MDI3339728.1 penicillin-binding protein 2 [Sphaerobacter sp.]
MRRPYQIPRRRINLLFAVFLIFTLAISYRVVSFQVVRGHQLAEEARAIRYREEAVPAQRGEILDARGRPLATNVPVDRVVAIRDKIEDPRRTAELLAPILGRSADSIYAQLTDPDLEWVWLQRHLSPEASEQIRKLDLDGILLTPEPRRIYPMGDFASHVLGFVNYDYVGSYGVEGAYNDTLGGEPGKLIGERDAAGNVIALSRSTLDPPVDGANVVLTIDSAVQRVAEQALDEAIAAQGATGGTVIVQNAKTGAILAMASRPTYNPNEFERVTDPALFTNPAISATYEPGSTLKALVMALGLETGVVEPDTTWEGAQYRIIPGGARITNALEQDFGPETMTEVLQHSSNLGIMWVADLINQDRFYRGLVAFGLGQTTGVDLAAESAGILPLPGTPGWTPASFYTHSFGQGLAVTPLQLVNAISALANGGNLMRPYVVQEIQRPEGTETIAPQVVRRVVSAETSRKITAMMTTVMGTTYARFGVPGYHIAAKTGTAQIPSPDGGYEEDATIASMVGFGPSEDPQFTVLVKIDRPQQSPWGETAAGPAFQQIFRELFLLYGIPPSDSAAAQATPSVP